MEDEEDRGGGSWEDKGGVVVWAEDLKEERDGKVKEWCGLTSGGGGVGDGEEGGEFEKGAHIRGYPFNWYSC